MGRDITQGPVIKTLIAFAIPMILGDLLQQCYNIADTLIVGQFLGTTALGAVGSAFSLMTFITSIILGLAMGSGTIFSMRFGQKDEKSLKESILASFILILIVTVILDILVYVFIDQIIELLNTPSEMIVMMHDYLFYVFMGLLAIFLYNFFGSLLRSLGDSIMPLVFLAISAILNIILDLYFVAVLNIGVQGAAIATVLAQYISGFGIMIYTCKKYPDLLRYQGVKLKAHRLKEIANFSFLTCLQQSIMNLGILMVQGLVNSFGTVVMASFAASVKIDAFAYLPVQDLGNAFSIFISQNFGADKKDRIKKGIKAAFMITVTFGIITSLFVNIFAYELLGLFSDVPEVIAVGREYLLIEGSFYALIGILFLLYGLYRAICMPMMSVILTILSLGTRVVLAYILADMIGVIGIWWSVPIGWILADLFGIIYYFIYAKKKILV